MTISEKSTNRLDDTTSEMLADTAIDPHVDLSTNQLVGTTGEVGFLTPVPELTDRELAEETLWRLRQISEVFDGMAGMLQNLTGNGANPLSIMKMLRGR